MLRDCHLRAVADAVCRRPSGAADGWRVRWHMACVDAGQRRRRRFSHAAPAGRPFRNAGIASGVTMLYEPDTIWGRTAQGDHEIAKPRRGLSLAQRRLLKRLTPPRKFTALAAKLRVEPPILETELVRLAQLELVAFQRPGVAQPHTAPRTAPRIDLALTPGGTPALPRHTLTVPLGLLAFALGIAAVLLATT